MPLPSPEMRLVTSKDSIGKKMINGVSIPKRGPTIQNSIGHKVSENRGRNMHEEIRKAQSLNLVLFSLCSIVSMKNLSSGCMVLFAFQKERLMSRLYLLSPSVLIEFCPYRGKNITIGLQNYL